MQSQHQIRQLHHPSVSQKVSFWIYNILKDDIAVAMGGMLTNEVRLKVNFAAGTVIQMI